MKSAILGGSFNPVHLGHLNLANTVLRQTEYNHILFVPAGTPPHKHLSPGAGKVHRLRMLELALDGRSCFSIWDGELSRPGRSYTIDTVRELRRQGLVDERPGLIIGDDLAADFNRWHRAEELVHEVQIILARRNGHQAEELPFTPLALDNELWPWSSTEVRALIADGKDTGEILPPAVAGYIRENHLYGHTG